MTRLEDILHETEYPGTGVGKKEYSRRDQGASLSRRSLSGWRKKAREATDFKEILNDDFFAWLENTLHPSGYIKSVWEEYTESEAAAAKAFASHGHYVEAMRHAQRASEPLAYKSGQQPVEKVFRENPRHIRQLEPALSASDVETLRNKAIANLELPYAERRLEKAGLKGDMGGAEEIFAVGLQSVERCLTSGETEKVRFYKENIDKVKQSYKASIRNQIEEALYDALQLWSEADKKQSIKRSFERVTEISKAYLDRFNPSFRHDTDEESFFTYVESEFKPLRKELIRCSQSQDHVYHDLFETPGIRLDEDDPKNVSMKKPTWDPRSDSLVPVTDTAKGRPVADPAYHHIPYLASITQSARYPSLHGQRVEMVEEPEMRDTPSPKQVPMSHPTWTGPVSRLQEYSP